MEFSVWAKLASRFWNFIWRTGSMEQSKWASLPDVVIVEVYKYLKDKDKLNAALTCKNWARLFHAPCLWRIRNFDIGGYRAQMNGSRACQFADKFGSYIRYLSVSCNHPSYHTAKIFQKVMEDLLIKIRSAKIIEFEMERLELDRFWKFETSREKLITSLVRFFKSQKYLRTFDMTAAQYPLTGGCRVLEAIGVNSGDKIKELYIEDFFQSRISAFQIPRFRNLLTCFNKLEFIALNYNCLSEEIIDTFAKNLAGKLECLNIKVYRNDPHHHRISGFAWRALKKACPKLHVTLWFENIGQYTHITPILVKDSPIRDIHIWTGYEDDTEWRLRETIDHITDNFKTSVESISIEMDNNHEMVDESVIRLLTSCKQLRDFTINAIIMISTIEVICDLQSERKINLQSLHVTACGLTEIEWAELCQLKDNYDPVFQERGVDFKLSSDLLLDLT